MVRLVLVAGVAVALLAGTFGVGGPSGAAAMPNYTCGQARNIAMMYLQNSLSLDALGFGNLASYYYGRYDELADLYYPCGDWGGNGGD